MITVSCGRKGMQHYCSVVLGYCAVSVRKKPFCDADRTVTGITAQSLPSVDTAHGVPTQVTE